MKKKVKAYSPKMAQADLKKLFSAPVLTSEDLRAYETLMARFLEDIEPRNSIELMLVKDLADATWDIMRYSNHKALLIEREFQRKQDIERKRLRLEERRKAEGAYYRAEDRKKSKESVKGETAEEGDQQGEQVEATDEVEQAGAPTTLFDRMVELEEVVDSTEPDVDEILLAPADELDHAAALEARIDYFEQLERLLSVAIARRNDTLRQFEFCRQALGQHLRRVSDEIIEGEFSETKHEAPSIAGPDDDEDAQ